MNLLGFTIKRQELIDGCQQAQVRSINSGCIKARRFFEFFLKGIYEIIDFASRTSDVVGESTKACVNFVDKLGDSNAVDRGAGYEFQHAKSRHRAIVLSRYRETKMGKLGQ